MTLRRFHNALRILLNIALHELVEAEIIGPNDISAWKSFRSDPFRWFIIAEDDQAAKLWTFIEEKQSGNNISQTARTQANARDKIDDEYALALVNSASVSSEESDANE